MPSRPLGRTSMKTIRIENTTGRTSRRDIARRERLGEADEQAAEHRAGNAADPADDGGGEPLQAGEEAHEVEDLAEDEAEHHAGRARERRADEEGRRDHAVDVDPHHRRRLAVERRRAHRLAEPRAATKTVSTIISTTCAGDDETGLAQMKTLPEADPGHPSRRVELEGS